MEELREPVPVKMSYPYSEEYGRDNDGYLLDQLPYHIAHILVKVSAEADNHTQGTITEAEARKLSDVVRYLAGDENLEGTTSKRARFGDIAKQQSDDTGSAERYGELSVMDRKRAFRDHIARGEMDDREDTHDDDEREYCDDCSREP